LKDQLNGIAFSRVKLGGMTLVEASELLGLAESDIAIAA
jgi:hypothetical protein